MRVGGNTLLVLASGNGSKSGTGIKTINLLVSVGGRGFSETAAQFVKEDSAPNKRQVLLQIIAE